jgi:hypothetical protein
MYLLSSVFFEVVNASFKIELIPTRFEIIIGQCENKCPKIAEPNTIESAGICNRIA